jgi:isocitrate dehydrogenase
MFEAIHGSAPRRAGQNVANPSGLLLGAIMMLVHIGQNDVAERVHNAWLRTIEDGIHTYDIYTEGVSKQKVSTSDFAKAVAARMGQLPETLNKVSYAGAPRIATSTGSHKAAAKKQLVGADIFLHLRGIAPMALGEAVSKLSIPGIQIGKISNRGQIVWPKGAPETFCVDHWRLRYFSEKGEGEPVTHQQIIDQMSRLAKEGYDVIKMEGLYTFDGEIGYSQVQGA